MYLTINNTIIEHPDDVNTGTRITSECFPGDEMIYKSIVDFNFDEGDGFKNTIQQARMRVVASKSTPLSFDESFDSSFVGQQYFIMDEFNYSFAGVPLNAFNFPNPNFLSDRPYVLDSGDPRRQISITNTILTSTNIQYEFRFPSIFRWEYWKPLLTASDEFIDYTQPQNGKNQFWFHYQTGEWTIGYVFEFDILDNSSGIVTTSRATNVLTAKDYDSNAMYHDKAIRLFDGGLELPAGYMLGTSDTTVSATFIYDTPDITDVFYGVMWIETYEGEGVNERTRISSEYDLNALSMWKAYYSSPYNRLLISVGGGIVNMLAYIDYTKIPVNVPRFTIYARLYNDKVGLLGEEIMESDIINIPEEPKPSPPPVSPPTLPGCGFNLVVFGDTGSNDNLKNDKSEILRWGSGGINNITFTLERMVTNTWSFVADLDDTTYGTLFPYGFRTDAYGKTYAGFLVDWKKVLDGNGENTYRVKVTYGYVLTADTYDYSQEYCLQQYMDHRAKRTVRIEAYMRGLNSNMLTPNLFIDYGSSWYQQVRLCGRLLYTKSSYSKEFNQYGDTSFNYYKPIINEQSPKFSLELKPIPGWLDLYLATNILQADSISITDYNPLNRHSLVSLPVINDGDYTPKNNNGLDPLSAVTLDFAYAQNNLRSRNN
jgi:hypothetical protein